MNELHSKLDAYSGILLIKGHEVTKLIMFEFPCEIRFRISQMAGSQKRYCTSPDKSKLDVPTSCMFKTPRLFAQVISFVRTGC